MQKASDFFLVSNITRPVIHDIFFQNRLEKITQVLGQLRYPFKVHYLALTGAHKD